MRQIEKDIFDFVKFNVEDSAYIYESFGLWVVDESEESEMLDVIDHLELGENYFSMLTIYPKEEKIIVSVEHLPLNSQYLSEETLKEIFEHIKRNVEKVKLHQDNEQFIRSELFKIFSSFCDLGDATTLVNLAFDRVKEDIEECADKEFNESDVRMALGRLMLDKFCEEY